MGEEMFHFRYHIYRPMVTGVPNVRLNALQIPDPGLYRQLLALIFTRNEIKQQTRSANQTLNPCPRLRNVARRICLRHDRG
jgi:hypothetical protein